MQNDVDLKDLTDFNLQVSDSLSFDLQFSEEIKIDRTCLEQELEEQPRKYAKYSSLCAILNKKLTDVKREVKEAYARLDAQVRELGRNNGTKLTETMIENMVITDPSYVEKQKEEANVSLMVDLLDGFRESFKQRKDMIVQLAMDNRQSTFDTRVYSDYLKDRK